jgi:hypothetical protein
MNDYGVSFGIRKVYCDLEKVQDIFDQLIPHAEGILFGFIFNLDESGFEDWACRSKRTVIILATYRESEITCLVDRATKRSSLLVCISVDGTYLKLMLILPWKTIEREVVEQGISEVMYKMVYQEYGFISTGLFEE